MTPKHGRRVLPARTLVAALRIGAGGAIALPLMALAPGAQPQAPLASPTSSVSFDISHTIVPVGKSRVIPFRLASAAPADTVVSFESSGAGLEIVRQGAVMAGQSLGFVRVRALSAGAFTLTSAASGSKLEVRAVKDPTLGAAPREELSSSPRIVTPVSGAWVWPSGDDGFSVGVEWFDDGEDKALEGRKIKLELADGSRIDPDAASSRTDSPNIRASFSIPAKSLKPGDLSIVPVAIDAAGAATKGQPIKLHVASPSEGQIVTLEAEDFANASRPFGQNRGRIPVQNDPKCSGGKFTSHPGSEPALTYTPEITETGWYQLIVTASGDAGGAGLPAIGLQIDGAQYPATSGRLATTGWHRIPIGTPVRIQPGFRALSMRYENDVNFKDSDRNLRLDRFELMRIDTGSRSAIPQLAGGGDQMMMAGGDQMASNPQGMDAAANAGSINAMDMQMMAAAAGGPGAEINDPDFLYTRPVRVAFKTPIDGLKLTGPIEIAGLCAWQGQGERPAAGGLATPLTTLMVNGVEHSTQRSTTPRFWVSPGWFARGTNTFQLVSRDDAGVTARSPVQTLTWDGAAGEGASQARFKRITVRDAAWEPAAREKVQGQNDIDEKRRLTFAGGSQYAVDLPDDWQGTFRVYAEARGGGGKNGAKLHVRSKGEPLAPDAKFTAIPSYWETIPIGSVTLSVGTKQLVVAAENAKGSPGVEVQSLLIEQVPPEASHAGGVVEVAYPADGPKATDVFAADAVVFTPTSGKSLLRSAELIIDGKPTGLAIDIARQPGPFVLPLLARGLTPGNHTVSVEVKDADGHKLTSPARSINVLAAAPSEPSRYDRAVRLLDRMAFGPDQRELAAVLTMGEEAWLRDRLWKADDAGDRAGFESSCVRFANNRDYNDVQRRAFGHATFTSNPARARFVFWLNNHFTTWIRKVEPDLKWTEYAMFARLGPTTFPELLYASATSPAMLRYLDQERSVTGRLNENYAREIMELHTLGVHGGYKQEDVTSLAKLLNGWTTYAAAEGRGFGAARDLEFRYDPKLNSGKPVTVFGMEFAESSPGERFDRVHQAIEMLAAHPATADFVTRSLLEHYVCCPPPEEMVTACSKVFRETGGDMREVLLAAARHPAFWSTPDRVSQPIDYAVLMQRVTPSPNVNAGTDYLRRSRQGLFDCPTPNGYSDKDADYVDSNALLQRLRLARDTMYNLAACVPNSWRYAPDKDANLPEDWNQRVVDLIAVRMTGRTLGEASNTAALQIIAETEGNRDARVREAAVFVAQSPEASLR